MQNPKQYNFSKDQSTGRYHIFKTTATSYHDGSLCGKVSGAAAGVEVGDYKHMIYQVTVNFKNTCETCFDLLPEE